MKRIISLLCVAMLLLCSLAAPAMAAENEDSAYLELLDYGFSLQNGSNSNAFGGGSVVTFTYDLPYRATIQYVDVLFPFQKNASPTVKWYSGDTVKGDLAVVNVNGNVFRAFGSVNAFYTGSVTLEINAGYNNTGRVTIESLKVGRDTYAQTEIEAYCEISAGDYSNTIHYVPTDESNKRNFTGTTDYTNAGYNLFIYTNEWRRFDYIDFMVYTEVDSVSSISCTIGTTAVPHEVSFISNDSMTNNIFCYTIRMDLTGVDRSVNDYPMITVSGNVSTGNLNLISMLGCVGITNISVVEPDVFWFSKIVSGLSSIGNQLFSGFGSMSDVLADIAAFNETIIERIETTGTQILNPGFSSITKAIGIQVDVIKEQFSSLAIDIQEQTDQLGDMFASLESNLYGMREAINLKLDDVRSKIVTSVNDMKSTVNANLVLIQEDINEMSAAVTAKLDDVRSKIVTSINNMKTALSNKLDEVIAAIHGDTTSGDEFKEELSEQEQDFQEMQQVMDSVTKPAVDDIDVSVDSYIDMSHVSTLGSVYSVFLSGSLFGPMIIMSILMATVSFALFGKR